MKSSNTAALSSVKKRIVVNAGHHNTDPGAISATERDEVKQIRNELVPLLKAKGFEVIQVPDDKTLPQSIAFANLMAPGINEGLLIDIHLNSSGDKTVRGVEAFHYTNTTSKLIADRMAFHVSTSLGLKNRGGKPDTATAAGSLGWIRQTKAYATLIEVCFISSPEDMKVLTAPGGYKKAAQGIVNAVVELYGASTPTPTKPEVADAIKLIEQGVAILKQL